MASKHIPSTVRKIVALRSSHKFREVAKIVTEPTPKPGEGEILVKNRFVGINASDINFTAGRYDPKAKFPLDTGFEALGEVVAAGPKSLYQPGQAVMYCQYGAFSDYKVVNSNRVIPLPAVKAEFLPFILSGNTAAISLDRVQWAKLKGCHVIGTCSSDEKVQFLKKGVDVVYEAVGGEMFDTCVDSLALKGRLIIIGYIEGYESDKGYKPSRVLATLPARVQYFNEGRMQSIVDKGERTPGGPFKGLEKVADAVEYLYSKKSIGKIVVELGEDTPRSNL
ncbi:PTGR3-like protein [Mya arenaria]|uniref:PTGR3-like protein n=1 Tax=Mya arenaria TaxID=6604 RepID=A0ABY7DXS6_MYAAR|nr:PTGR3-like protein [Mya arenaria]